MKKLLRYGIYVAVLCVTFTAGYYISYRRAYDDRNSGARLEAQTGNDDAPDVAGSGISPEQNPVVGASSSGSEVVKPSTRFILETIDVDKGTTLREDKNPTGDFVGLNREEIIAYLESYMENLPLAEYEKGLSSYELVSFSSKEFCIRKTYDSSINPNKFFITLKNNYVIIYYSDKTSVYDYTSINGNSLSYGDKLELLKGFYVKDSEELYAILEGYTS